MKPAEPVLLQERPVQLQGSGLARACLRWAGWTVEFDGLPARQGVIVAYPHTSNWDFVLAMLAKWSMGIPVTFWGKDSLFRVPVLGRWMRWIGGVPVDRGSPRGMVGEMVERMHHARTADQFLWLALAPEGTRALAKGWRSGFYQVATGADVPLALAYFDFSRRRVGITACLQLSGRRELDMPAIATHYAQVRGLRQALASPIQLNES